MLAKTRRRLFALARLLPAALAALPTGPVSAQQAVLEEVIVTARKRVESLQETPVAVTALDEDALRNAGVRNLADLNQLAPNIEVASARGTAPLANIFIRGVGQRNSGANIDSGVGIYIDGIYVGRPDGALLELNDIQSVQVLRGPQGTLFGKNTTGGALVFTTNRPVDELEGSISARVGNYDRLDGDFVLNVPLTDDVWSRLSGVYRSRDGYIDNLFDGDDYMDEDRKSVIWQTRWAPSQDWLLDLNINWAETDQTMRPQKCVLVPEYSGWQAVLFDTIAVFPATGRTYDDFCEDSAAAGGGDPNKVISDLGGDYYAQNKGAAVTAEWALNEDLSLKSISGWRATEAAQNDDLDHTGIPFLHRTNSVHPFQGDSDTDQYSQEFQLTGSGFDDQLQYVAGLYWFREKTSGRVEVSYLGPFDPAIADWFFFNTSATELSADNEAFAAFAQAEWEFNDQWRLTAGLRYTDEERKLDRDRYRVIPDTLDANGGPVVPLNQGIYAVSRPDFRYNPAFAFEYQDFTSGKTSEDDMTPMASLMYLVPENDWLDVGMFYLTYSEGFLSGGISEAPGGLLDKFEPEEVENWELGFKLDLLNSRLRLNGAFFHSDYTNRQLTTIVIDPVINSVAPDTINAAESTIQGFELETTWLATHRLMLTFNMTLNDGDIDEFEDQLVAIAATPEVPAGCIRTNLVLLEVDQCPNDRSNENLPRLPEQTYLIAAQYAWDSPWGRVQPRVQASWKLDIDFCFDSVSCDTGRWFEDEQFELGATITWVSPNEKWVGTLYGSNLTDEDALSGGVALVESSGVGGYSVVPPRMYGVELEYRF